MDVFGGHYSAYCNYPIQELECNQFYRICIDIYVSCTYMYRYIHISTHVHVDICMCVCKYHMYMYAEKCCFIMLVFAVYKNGSILNLVFSDLLSLNID